jgi:hypothetical protein
VNYKHKQAEVIVRAVLLLVIGLKVASYYTNKF